MPFTNCKIAVGFLAAIAVGTGSAVLLAGCIAFATSTCNFAVDADVLRVEAMHDYGSCLVFFDYFAVSDTQRHNGSTVLPCASIGSSHVSAGLQVVKVCYSEARPWQYVAAPAKFAVESVGHIVALVVSGGVVLSAGLLVLLAMWAFCVYGPKQDVGVVDAVALVTVAVDGQKL